MHNSAPSASKNSRKIGSGKGPQMSGEKAKDLKGTFQKLAIYLRNFKFQISVVFVFAVCSTIFAIVGPKILGSATSLLYSGVMNNLNGNGGVDFVQIAQILITLLILFLVSAAFSYIQGFIMSGVANKITFQMRKEIDEKIHRLPFSYYDRTSTGDVLSRITNDVDVINQSLVQSSTQIITSATSLVGIIVMMLSISWQMTLIAVFTLPLSFGIIAIIVKKSQKYFQRQQQYLGLVNGQVEEVYSAHTIVKAFNREEAAYETFSRDNNVLYDSAWKSQFFSGLMMPIMQFIGNIGYVLVSIIGGYLVIRGSIMIGDIQAFIQYMRQFTQPISQVSQISAILQQTAAAAERIFTFLDEQEETQDYPNAISESDHAHFKGEIEFRNVSFGYSADKIIVKNFNAHIKPGQKIAIVGPTGAGKTTMVKLLMRFYDVTSGAILVDGVDIRQYQRSYLRSAFGMVLQDTWLFNGSFADNIRYGKLSAGQDEIIASAKAAQINRYIRTLPEGYETLLNEESTNVSQGQKQLLTIARTILADPRVLILDEATSNVDTRTEIQIQKAMDLLMQDRTSFIIAHRLSTIRNADLIFVMKDGDIVEQGTHEELLHQNGFYAGLYNSQFSH